MMTINSAVHRERGVEWSVAGRAVPGESVSGDQHVVAATDDGVLLAVIDGLGHGDEATYAAQRAASVLAAPGAASVLELIQRCHRALRTTRGAAMTLVALNHRERRATALGIGNVETVLVRADPLQRPARESVLLRNGVVGYQLPMLQMSEMTIAPGDVVVFATDGVREDFGDRVVATDPLPQLVDRILAQKFRGTDDALVLACKFVGDHED